MGSKISPETSFISLNKRNLTKTRRGKDREIDRKRKRKEEEGLRERKPEKNRERK